MSDEERSSGLHWSGMLQADAAAGSGRDEEEFERGELEGSELQGSSKASSQVV